MEVGKNMASIRPKGPARRKSRRSEIFRYSFNCGLGIVTRATFSCNLPCKVVALQVKKNLLRVLPPVLQVAAISYIKLNLLYS